MTAGSFPGTAGRVGAPVDGKALLDVLGVAVVVIDARGRIVLWSAQTESPFGFLADEALGLYVARVIVDWDHRAEAMRLFGEVLRGGTAWTVTFPVRDKDGSTRRVEFRSMRIPDDLGDLYALGIAADGAVVERSVTEPALSDRLVSQSPIGLAVLDAALRYVVRNSAVTLQRGLLPGVPPELTGLEVAARYHSAHASSEVGGDWYDVIALPGDKTALVVGDVMGGGIDAGATMGRLWTVTCAFANLDLSPGQVLQHLDRITAGLEQYIAACLFVAYHLVRQRCRIANAGHLPPLRSPADGPAELMRLSTGVSLGVVGGTFWTVRVPLRAGDRLVLYTDGTDGLIETRHEAIDERSACLVHLLDEARGPLEETCDRFLRVLRRTGAPDDVALLIARSTG
ncbi:PP2C family protein-serine/threonine phosphatase [Streptomyces xanthii]|uniref:SpoIIE family protein phosphatase n=1 Tax=Streptomyces xanthii TaxID=2768069 RepID=A0A7H1BK78_9ACTN|nr:SpoIIE family protein phosphatase [Streptomyces xanthii]QNS09133.1 SpoIIE family protein phosphatase [Streptomyces xanthii]